MRRAAARLVTFFALAASVLPCAALAQTPVWTRSIAAPANMPASVGDGHIVGRSFAVDASGNAFVTGTAGTGSGSDILTTKLAAAGGSPLWQKVFAASGGGEDHGMSVAVDAAGNAFVAGLATNGAGNTDIVVLKYAAADGTLAWQKTFDAGSYDGAYVVAVDASGNAVVGAESTNAAGNIDIRILKLAAANGSPLWDRSYDGGSDDYVADLVLDRSGNVLVAGTSMNAAGNNDFTILRLDGATGAITWHRSFDSGGNDEAFGIAADASGNAFVTGFTTGANADFRTLKLAAADGSIVWQQSYDGGSDDYGQAVATDSAGNAIVTGQSRNAAGNVDFMTIKYAAKDGAVLWRKAYDGGADDYAYNVAIDASDNAIVVGSSASAGNADWKAIGYASADGSVIFERGYAGSGAADDVATQVAVSPTGYLVAGGALESGAAPGVRVELLPPVKGAAAITSPAPGSALSGATVTFQWNDAGATLYQLWIGTSPGAYDIGYFPARGTTSTSTIASGLPTDGRKLYVRLYSYLGGAYVYRDYTYSASGTGGASASPSGPASITAPAPGATLTGSSQLFQWNNAGASLYQLWVGSSAGAFDVGYFPQSGTTATSITATGLPTDGRTLHVRLYSAINGVWQFRDFTYTAAGSGAAGPPAPASITSPPPGSTLAGTSQLFQWNNSGAGLYQLWVGSTQGAYDAGYFPQNGTTGTSVNATGLPTDGRTLYVRLYSNINGAYQFRDFTYTAAGAGGGGGGAPAPATMASPANGTTLSGSTVTFAWNAASGASLYQVWVGTSPGTYDIGYYPSTGTTTTTTTATGLPTDGRTLYVRLYSAIGGSWYYRDFTYRSGP